MPGLASLKVDVDTFLGTRDGVPRLLDLFATRGVKATFFVTLGPDRSGLAIRRVFRRGFLTKMFRTGAVRMYGIRTMLYGTLLPAPVIARRSRESLRRIRDAGHEVGLHAWDHVAWHDGVFGASPETSAAWLAAGREAFLDVYGEPPRAAAAPAWRCTAASLAAIDAMGCAYASDTRGDGPFHPAVPGRRFATLQIPTTLPTLDEVWGRKGTGTEIARYYLERLAEERSHVLGIHAEGEGGSHFAWFAGLLDQALRAGVRFRTLGEWRSELGKKNAVIPVSTIERRELPGRPGAVCVPAAFPPPESVPMSEGAA